MEYGIGVLVILIASTASIAIGTAGAVEGCQER